MSQAELPIRTVVERYDALVARGSIDRDPAQAALAARLDALNERLETADLAVKGSSLGWLFGRKTPKREPIRGLYIHGEVGRGKTMLMDLFFDLAHVKLKRRVHFHAFMADVQGRIHAARTAILEGRIKGDDPIAPVADAIAAETRLLCFDEFAVYDIADAMILGRLFTRLFEKGVVMVATSNVMPDRLYWDGLNRALFLPFIELLKTYVDVVRLSSATDYRLEKTDLERSYLTPLGPDADMVLEEVWFRLTGHKRGARVVLPFRGRSIEVPQACGEAARFDFRDLCEKPLGAADYLEIAGHYGTIFVEHVPVMTAQNRNAAKRFINLIDALYDRHVRLVISAAAEPDRLWAGEDGVETFEFQRTASRLTEMRSVEYIAARKDAASTGG